MKDNTKSLTRRVGLFRIPLAIAAWIGIYVEVSADEASDIRAGQELAEKVCSRCHVVGERQEPPFAEIAKGSHAEPSALLAFLRSTHSNVSHPGTMPNLELAEQEIDQISAYLGGLRAKK